MTVLEAFDFLLAEAPTLGSGKPLEGYDMLGDYARARDLALERAANEGITGWLPGQSLHLRLMCGPGPLST